MQLPALLLSSHSPTRCFFQERGTRLQSHEDRQDPRRSCKTLVLISAPCLPTHGLTFSSVHCLTQEQQVSAAVGPPTTHSNTGWHFRALFWGLVFILCEEQRRKPCSTSLLRKVLGRAQRIRINAKRPLSSTEVTRRERTEMPASPPRRIQPNPGALGLALPTVH